VVVKKFKLHGDQVEAVESALSKAKAEIGTEHDNVALETICSGYLAGVIGIEKPQKTLQDQMTEMGWEAALVAFSELFPQVDLEVTVQGAEQAAEATA
jgi:hypothetical protein